MRDFEHDKGPSKEKKKKKRHTPMDDSLTMDVLHRSQDCAHKRRCVRFEIITLRAYAVE